MIPYTSPQLPFQVVKMVLPYGRKLALPQDYTGELPLQNPQYLGGSLETSDAKPYLILGAQLWAWRDEADVGSRAGWGRKGWGIWLLTSPFPSHLATDFNLYAQSQKGSRVGTPSHMQCPPQTLYGDYGCEMPFSYLKMPGVMLAETAAANLGKKSTECALTISSRKSTGSN